VDQIGNVLDSYAATLTKRGDHDVFYITTQGISQLVQRSDSYFLYLLLVKPMSQLRFDYDTTMIRRYHDAFDSDTNDRSYDMCSIRLRYDYDNDYDEKLTCSFICLHGIGSRHARYIVVVS